MKKTEDQNYNEMKRRFEAEADKLWARVVLDLQHAVKNGKKPDLRESCRDWVPMAILSFIMDCPEPLLKWTKGQTYRVKDLGDAMEQDPQIAAIVDEGIKEARKGKRDF